MEVCSDFGLTVCRTTQVGLRLRLQSEEERYKDVPLMNQRMGFAGNHLARKIWEGALGAVPIPECSHEN